MPLCFGLGFNIFDKNKFDLQGNGLNKKQKNQRNAGGQGFNWSVKININNIFVCK